MLKQNARYSDIKAYWFYSVNTNNFRNWWKNFNKYKDVNIGVIVQFLYTDGILKWKNLTVYSLTGIAIMSVYEISSL